MNPIYDSLLGRVRESDAPKPIKPELILHLPLRENGDDIGKNHLIPATPGSVAFTDGWAVFSAKRIYQLSEVDFSNMTISGNIQIPLNITYRDIFGIESNENTFFLQKRSATQVVIETIYGSFNFDITQANNNTPFHFAATYDGAMIRCFLNGVHFTSRQWNLSFPNSQYSIWASTIKMSDLRLYSFALNDAEVNDIYQTDRRI